MDLPAPTYIHTNADQIIQEMTAYYEKETNRKLQPAQAEMLLINAFAYREQLLRVGINEAGLQNLVSFARFPALDFLGEIVGVTRLPAQPATCTIRVTMIAGHGGVVVPQGLRIQSIDGKAVFILNESKSIPPGTTTTELQASCTVDGIFGNNYAPGEISIILDPQPYLTSAENTITTTDGADGETDEELRERIRLAPSQFSVAGPEDAYKFFAKGAHPSIVDIAVTSPVPGQVNVYPLVVNGGQPSQEIKDAVLAACNGDKRRPLTDTVIVDAPLRRDYSISVNLTLYNDAVNVQVVEQVRINLENYVNLSKNRLGIDIVQAQIIGRSMISGVYTAQVVSPISDLVLAPYEYGNCTGITVNVVGTSDE